MILNLGGGRSRSPVVTQDANGYIILPTDGDGYPSHTDDWEWYGTNCELVDSVFTTVALEDTSFATWTPSTTTTTIWTKQFTPPALLSGYVYDLAFKFLFNPVYQTGTTVLSGVTKLISMGESYLYSYPASVANWNTGTTSNGSNGGTTLGYLFYKNASGNDAFTGSSYTGIYAAANAITNTIDVRAVANSTYFTTTMMSALDQTESTFTIDGRIYRLPKDNAEQQVKVYSLIDMYQNGLTNQ